jgi:serine/threonine-protein kinase
MTDQPQKLGKYQLLRHLATGGMAEIWLAEQEGPGGFNKELVIKRILPTYADDSKFTTMFLDEARLAAQLSHPKIAQIYELGEIDGQYFIAMEYIQGIDLDVLLNIAMDKGEPMPIPVVCKILMDVLEALDYAHEFIDRDGQPAGLVHRDVSPHNVLVSNDGIVKLCDFGVAKAKANQTKTQPGAVKGKFAYMAPEQIQNARDLDRRADVFAAGILFYELLTGVKPFGDELAAVNAIIAQPHPDPRTHRDDIPPELANIIDHALAKSRDERYPDAHAMLRDIEAWVRGTGEFVGDRELSQYVRQMQGLPVTRHSQSSVRVGTGPSARVDPLGDTGEQTTPTSEQIAADRQERITDREDSVDSAGNDGAGVPTSGSPPTSTSSSTEATVPNTGPRTAGTAVDEDMDEGTKNSGGNGLLIAVFVIFILGIIAAIAVIALYVLPPPTGDVEDGKEVTKQQTTDEDPAPKGNRRLLTHPGGLPVWIKSRPSGAQLYVDDKLVGETPFETTLLPGEYEIELRSGDNRVDEKFKVESGKPIQRFQFEL